MFSLEHCRRMLILLLFCSQFSASQSFLLLRPGCLECGRGLAIAQSGSQAISGLRRLRNGSQQSKTRHSSGHPFLMKREHDRDHDDLRTDPLDDIRINRRAVVNTLWFGVGGFAGYLIRDRSISGQKQTQQPHSALSEFSELKDAESEISRDLDDLKKLRQETEREMESLKERLKEEDNEETRDDTPLQKVIEIAPFGLILAGLAAQIRFVRREWEYAAKSYAGSQFTFGELILYRLDHYLSTEPFFKTLLLANAAFLIILVGASLLVLSGQGDFGNELWVAWTLVADAGTESDATGPLDRAIAFAISVGGLVVFALLVGVVTESVVEQVEDFKKGSSRVLERDHTVMLGFSDKSLSIIEQIALSRVGQESATVVVIAEKPKDVMERTVNPAIGLRVRYAKSGTDVAYGAIWCYQLKAALNDKERGFKLYGTEVIFRTGDPAVESELFKVGADRAKRIIALSRDDLRPQEADALMLRQVLSLRGVVSGSEERQPDLVVELQDVDNKHLIDLISLKKEVLVTHDFIGRLMATVLEALMTFKGPEFYFKEWPELFGLKFEEIFTRFVDAVPVGIKKADGKIVLNPVRKSIYSKGDQLIVVADDGLSYNVSESRYEMPRRVEEVFQVYRRRFDSGNRRSFSELVSKKYWTTTITRGTGSATRSRGRPLAEQLVEDFDSFETRARRIERQAPEKILFVGWRRDMADMISDLDGAVPEGSELWLLNAVPVEDRGYLLTDRGNKDHMNLKNLVIKNAVGRPTLRQDLLRINCLDEFGFWTGESVLLTDFTSTLILSDEKGAEDFRQSDVRSADGRSLASFLLIREIRKGLQGSISQGNVGPTVIGDDGCAVLPPDGTLISEIVDSQNSISLLRELGCRSYIMSNEIVSSALAQISENPDMFGLISELFKDAGAGLSIVPIEDIIPNPSITPMCFWDVALQGLKQRSSRVPGELVIGYKVKEEPWMAMAEWMQYDADKDISWINPADKITPRKWCCGDVLVVISAN